MQWIVISLVILAICEPLLLDAKKVVLVMPRKIRRTQTSPWHQLLMYAKHAKPGQSHPGPRYGYSQAAKYYHPKNLPFAKDQYPRGGDDFDQPHDEVNHVMVPHGKGISHAVSFGNGYIPFDTYKNPQSVSQHHNYNVDHSKDIAYSPTMNLPVAPYSPPYLTQQADAYLRNEEHNENQQENKHDRVAQNFHHGRAFDDFSTGQQIRPHFGGVHRASHGPQGRMIGQHGGVVGASSIPSPTFGGRKQGFIFRDSVIFDDYNKQVAALTKNWPSSFSSNAIPGSNNHPNAQALQLSRQHDANSFSGTAYGSGQVQSQNQQGYAVKEEVADTEPHDFRASPMQSQVHLPLQIPHTPVQQLIGQQPVQQIFQQQPVQHILQQQPVQDVFQQQPVQHILQQQPAQQILQQPTAQHLVQQLPQQILYQQTAQHSQNLLSQPQINYAVPSFRGLVQG